MGVVVGAPWLHGLDFLNASTGVKVQRFLFPQGRDPGPSWCGNATWEARMADFDAEAMLSCSTLCFCDLGFRFTWQVAFVDPSVEEDSPLRNLC